MRILASVMVFFSLCSCAYASGVGNSLVLETGGGIFEPAFTVRLSASGSLAVDKTRTVNTEAKEFTRTLGPTERDHIFVLAIKSSDFATDCDQVADGTSARMRVVYKGSVHTFSCQNAPKWPVGQATTKFLEAINRFLPEDMRVF
jgi:hypothetical protein